MTGNGLYMPPIYFVKLGMIYEIVLLTLMSLILNIIVLLTLITHFTIVFFTIFDYYLVGGIPTHLKNDALRQLG